MRGLGSLEGFDGARAHRSRPTIRVTGRASAEYLLEGNVAAPPVDRIPIGTCAEKKKGMRTIAGYGGIRRRSHSVRFVRQLCHNQLLLFSPPAPHLPVRFYGTLQVFGNIFLLPAFIMK